MSDTTYTKEQLDAAVAKAIADAKPAADPSAITKESMDAAIAAAITERDAQWQAQPNPYKDMVEARHKVEMDGLSEANKALVLSLAGDDVTKQATTLSQMKHLFVAATETTNPNIPPLPTVPPVVAPVVPPVVTQVVPPSPITAPPLSPVVVAPVLRPALDFSGGTPKKEGKAAWVEAAQDTMTQLKEGPR